MTLWQNLNFKSNCEKFLIQKIIHMQLVDSDVNYLNSQNKASSEPKQVKEKLRGKRQCQTIWIKPKPEAKEPRTNVELFQHKKSQHISVFMKYLNLWSFGSPNCRSLGRFYKESDQKHQSNLSYQRNQRWENFNCRNMQADLSFFCTYLVDQLK